MGGLVGGRGGGTCWERERRGQTGGRGEGMRVGGGSKMEGWVK